MKFTRRSLIVCSCLVAGCSGAGAGTGENVGRAMIAVRLAPTTAKCAVVDVVNGDARVNREFDLAPEANTAFSLDQLPLGNDTFSARVFTSSCAERGESKPKWSTEPVTATIIAGWPADVTLKMVPTGELGRATVGLDFPAANPGTFAEFELPQYTMSASLVSGPEGALWFTELYGSALGRITTEGVVTELQKGGSTWLAAIAAGPDGNVWYADIGIIGRLSPGGTKTIFPIANCMVAGIVAGPDGALWFGDMNSNQIGRMTTNGSLSWFPIPTANSYPEHFAVGADGNIWFTENGANQLGRVDMSGNVTEFPVPTAYSGVFAITAGAGGAIWFTEQNVGQIGRIDRNGRISEFPLAPNKNALQLTAGPDGKIWFTEAYPPALANIDQDGNISEWAAPTPDEQPDGIAAGSDGNIWFTEGSRIGRLSL